MSDLRNALLWALLLVALNGGLARPAHCQELSVEEAGELARERASVALDVPTNSLGRETVARSRDSRGSDVAWDVSFENGTYVTMRGDGRRAVWVVSAPGRRLEHRLEAQRFRAAYRSVGDALEFARDVAARVGLVGGVLSPTSPAAVPAPDSQGMVQERRGTISLHEPHERYPSLMGGNRVEVVFDTRDFGIHIVHVVSGYRLEEPGGPTISESEAVATARASGGLGEVLQVTGPGFFQIVADDAMTVEGRQYLDEYTLPLAYVIRGEQRSVVVHAVTGRLLRHRARAVAGSRPEGKSPGSRTTAVRGSNLVAKPGGRRTNALHRRPGPGTVSLVLGAALAAAAVVAWSFVRTRGRLRR